ncbi:glucokinase [Bradyrhizobium sp. U87765 SZCCT0131]|uniref:glucokinase n=1 Tax=unclassified Bradyrhizobium TaxID=2631580 RepID=UPI001BAB9400|nr:MULTISPECIES: glucokinase [unclassified Bradyrhizobium]MBR1222352.1 glucokinase [Bradyrhizobium sp. U87765 SZCCT0131]MBR1264164.1 glucokinase [Bradyrhizobium sp. U87765 SZCCT0134]MBR1308053.1 glucokinase [Bradyrhizobium sp. U87765 SZCCT0110]MBR1320414.1 glucokinase [Bradyrhizobium sp. U87765 SZCCT0109]MBR1348473.1 glucokinase [Bradyrhizobium sp. U87765 SZCCT0048]
MSAAPNGRRVIADIGGTNARFAIAERGAYRALSHVAVRDYPTLQDALADYLSRLPADMQPATGVLAIAAPILGDEIHLTNQSWSFSIAALKTALGLLSLRVINDFAAVAAAIPYLPAASCRPIGPAIAGAHGPIGAIGPGTGLGVSSLVPDRGGWALVAGEGGHVTLPGVTAEEDAVIVALRRRWSHVSAERVLSGPGLVNLYEALCTVAGQPAQPLSPAEITDQAIRGTDPTCVATLRMFCAMLGTVAGNLAVTIGATGGIYLAGGIVQRFVDVFAASPFRARFEDKGRFQSYLERIPTVVIMDESPALLGLANYEDRRTA